MAKRSAKPIVAGSNSKGIVMGLEGDLFIVVLVSVFASVGVLVFLLFSPGTKDWSVFLIYGTSFTPTYLTLAYIHLFFTNRPPRYHADFWEHLFYGSQFNSTNRLGKNRLKHPKETLYQKQLSEG